MDNATIAKATMGTSLAFHIVFAALGVGVPLLQLRVFETRSEGYEA